jgi:DNA-binding XRE family transcriptional regulator
MKPNDRIKELRERAGLNRRTLAQLIGVTPTMITFYENGFRKPKIVTAKKIAKYLKCEWFEIYSE